MKDHTAPRPARRQKAQVPLACPSGKRIYLDRGTARKHSHLAQSKNGGWPLDVYRCRTCRQYHLFTRRNP